LGGIWGHLEELKQRIKVILIVFIAATAFFLLVPANPSDMLTTQFWLTGIFKPVVAVVLVFIKNLVAPSGIQVISLQVGAPFEVYVLASFTLGTIVTAPVIGYEIYKFVDPALLPRERRSVYPFTFAFTALFIGGALFGLFAISPFIMWALILFSGFVGAQPVLSVSDFYSTIFITVVLCGIVFTIPAMLVLLAKFGIIKTSMISKYRLYLYLVIFIAVSIITPVLVAMIAIFVPIVVMIEVSLFISKRYEKKTSETPNYAYSQPKAKSNQCKFCGVDLASGQVFCPKCKRSQI
jgi:sec-independent protein translocase protein TatC